ncbi:MAG: vitamin B12 dependent-methionine synthase activation domain-containing protein, partial [Fidelibacterota bacterium]
NHHPDATDKLIAHAATFTSQKHTETAKKEWRLFSMNERIIHALVNGIDRFIETDLREMLPRFDRALDIIEGPLMEGMSRVGDLFGSGKMFLPQVVKSARVMKKAVAWLDPYLKAEKSESADHNGTIILATVKGDVHDIGKNIVSVVLQCNNYHVIDLGVMVPAEQIIRTAQKENADFIGLSGLITPSLDEMVHMAKEMERLHFSIPLLIGGATTSKIHTAVKVDPSYSGPTIYIRDASHAVPVLNKLTNSSSDRFFQQIRSEYDGIRKSRASGSKKPPLLTLNECRKNRYSIENSGSLPFSPRQTGARSIEDYPLEELREYIDWTPFFHTWNIKGKYPQIIGESGSEAAQSLFNDAQNLLDSVISGKSLKAKAFIGIFPANRTGDDIRIFQNEKTVIAHHLRQQIRKAPEKPNYCLSDFLYSDDSGVDDWIGAFVVTAGIGLEELCARFNSDNDDYNSIMAKALADRLAEALAERIHERIRKEFWGYAADENLSPEELIQEKYKGIRPAPGYPANPDHSEKKLIFDLLDINPGSGIKLTEHFMMSPAASVCGWVFAHPESRYFNLGKIGEDQLCEYAQRKQISPEAARKMLQAYV